MFIVVGIVAIVFAVIIGKADVGTYVRTEYYGGDAFTGIQHAAAYTGENVKDLAEIVRMGFTFLFWIWGLTMIASGISSFISVQVTVIQRDKDENGQKVDTVIVDKTFSGELARHIDEAEKTPEAQS